MKTPKILASCLLAFALIGGASKSRNLLIPDSQTSNHSAVLLAESDRGRKLMQHGQYRDASLVFQSVYTEAQAASLPSIAGRALGNLGSCQFALHQFKFALHSFLDARRLAESAGDSAVVALADASIASLYFVTGELDAAAEWTARSLNRISGPDRARQLPKLQIELATLRALEGRMTEARSLFRQGINAADRAGDLELCAIGWNRLGEVLLDRGDPVGAEGPLLEAYRLRKLHHLGLDTSYRSLGRLRLAQGNTEAASSLLDRAVEIAAQPQGLMPTWDIFHSRALVRMAEGRLPEALSDLRIAQRLGRAWRWSNPSNQSLQMGAENMLDRVHSALVAAGNRLYLQTHDPALKQETFSANEENRAVSLRALWNAPKNGTGSSSAPELPGAYWEALARLQRAEVAAIKGSGPADLAGARAELVRMEASVGSEFRPLPDDLVDATRRSLSADTALFSFHLGEKISWVWALDRQGLEVYPLPDRAEIETQARTVTAAVKDDRADAAAVSAHLYQTLFGPVADRFRKAPRWLLALDGALFDLPISALVENPEGSAGGIPSYIAVNHTVELIPGVAYWLESGNYPAAQLSPLFVGVGDPIYNRADARGAHRFYGSSPGLVLPRLVASGAELEACARAWQGPALLLRGSDASREKLAAELQDRPAVVHVATHYVESAGKTHYSLIALSLSPRGDTEVLSPLEISNWRIHAGLVVLSGCHSAAGAALPGEGVFGLTRAWLAAGAHAVVGSLWDTPDDEGALFSELYRNLRNMGRLDAGKALHAAQRKMIQSGGRLGRPSYWGTYFAVASQASAVIPQEIGEER